MICSLPHSRLQSFCPKYNTMALFEHVSHVWFAMHLNKFLFHCLLNLHHWHSVSCAIWKIDLISFCFVNISFRQWWRITIKVHKKNIQMFHSKIKRFWQDNHLVIIVRPPTVVSYSVIQECLLRSALRPASVKQNGLEGMEERDEVTNRCMMKCEVGSPFQVSGPTTKSSACEAERRKQLSSVSVASDKTDFWFGK